MSPGRALYRDVILSPKCKENIASCLDNWLESLDHISQYGSLCMMICDAQEPQFRDADRFARGQLDTQYEETIKLLLETEFRDYCKLIRIEQTDGPIRKYYIGIREDALVHRIL